MSKILENEKLQKAWIFCKLWGGRIYKFICRIIVCATAAFVLFSFFSKCFYQNLQQIICAGRGAFCETIP